MIALVSGVLADRGSETVLVHTPGGVGYAITVPDGVLARLPAAGSQVTLHTELVVREDGWSLYGFDSVLERAVFQRLLTASGFGPKLALAILSTLGAERTVRSIQNRDLAALSSVSGVGKKKAERLALELRDRFAGIEVTAELPTTTAGEDAVRALVALGYTVADADDAVRSASTDGGTGDTPHLIRRALQRLAAARAGR